MKNLLVLFILITGLVHAESRITAKLTGAEMKEKGLLLDYLKLGCKDPAAVHNQVPPRDIKVFCHQEFCRWQLGTPIKVVKHNSKSQCGKIVTDKPSLGTLYKCSACSSSSTTFELPNLYEECGKFDTQYQVTCDQVIAMDSVEAFCLEHSDEELTGNDDIVEWTKTGKTQTAVMGPETTKPGTAQR